MDKKTLNVVVLHGKCKTTCGVNFPRLELRVSRKEKDCQINLGNGFREGGKEKVIFSQHIVAKQLRYLLLKMF